VPKASVGPEAKASVGPFGSVFFANLCRMTWQVKKQIGVSEDVVSVGLIPEKQNDGARVPAAGLEFSFTRDRIHVRPIDLAAVEGLSDKLPLHVRMVHALKRGPLPIVLLANELDAKPDSVEKAARRGAQLFNRVQGQDGITRLALVEHRVA
jgi:hypothetical protein